MKERSKSGIREATAGSRENTDKKVQISNYNLASWPLSHAIILLLSEGYYRNTITHVQQKLKKVSFSTQLYANASVRVVPQLGVPQLMHLQLV